MQHLESLAEAATPGPWEQVGGDEGRRIACQPARILGHPVVVCRVERTAPKHHDDAALIVALRNALPDILTRIRALTAERDALRDAVTRYEKGKS
jgi:hypothetical protein